MNYVDEVTKIAVDCGAVISRTLSDGAQTRVEFSRETLDFYTAAIEKLTEERARAECTTSDAVAWQHCSLESQIISDKEKCTWLQLNPEKVSEYTTPLYLAPPNYEALQAENAALLMANRDAQDWIDASRHDIKQLVDYVRVLRAPLQNFVDKVNRGEARSIHSYAEMLDALAFPLPEAMKDAGGAWAGRYCGV